MKTKRTRPYWYLTCSILFVSFLCAAGVLILFSANKVATLENKEIISFEAANVDTELPLNVPGFTWLIPNVGGRVDWSADGVFIAYDQVGDDGYFDVWTMRPDGSDIRCLSCDHPDLPSKHVGNPAWHPSGEYLLVQVLNEENEGALANTDLYQVYTNPGAGFRNELWLITADGNNAWPLTSVTDDQIGVLHPHFSHSGQQIVWSEMVSEQPKLIGSWVIKLADFLFFDDVPQIQNIQTLKPESLQWYEVHSFSPNDEEILFTGMPFGKAEENFDLYRYELATETTHKLNDSTLNEWDEHGHFTPDGEQIVWMSSMGISNNASSLNQFNVNSDYWSMNVDGTDKRRLTFFNEPSAPEYIDGQVIAADFSFSPDGNQIVAYIQHNPKRTKPGSIAIITVDK